MREMRLNVFNRFFLASLPAGAAVGVTTNTIINHRGELVMGAGVALAAKTVFPQLPLAFAAFVPSPNYGVGVVDCKLEGKFIIRTGEYQKIPSHPVRVFAFPTKENWRKPSTMARISQSITLVLNLFRDQPGPFYLPRPGCNLGGLDWPSQVKPLCAERLDDRFIICNL